MSSSRRIIDFRRRRPHRAFSLLEVLIALALVALVLTAMNAFVFSMGELWGRNSEARLFDLHVRNVTRFLERELRIAAFPPAVSAGAAAIKAEEIKTKASLNEAVLIFELPAGSRLMNWPERPLPDVVCGLAVRNGEGLVLLWHSRLEKRFEDDAPRESVISPYVQSLSYDYYDTDFKSWKTENTIRQDGANNYLAPQRLRLGFAYDGRTQDVLITLPAATEGLPIF